MLNTQYLSKALNEIPSTPEMDLFVSRIKKQLNQYVLYRPDPFTILSGYKILLFPPLQLYTQSCKKDHTRQSQGSSGSTSMANTFVVSHALTNTGTTTSRASTGSEFIADAIPARAEASSTRETTNSDLSCIRGKLKVKRFAESTIHIILSSRREGTQTQYQSTAKRWFEFCEKNNCDVISPPLPLAMGFLSDLFHAGISYSYINTARSVLSRL